MSKVITFSRTFPAYHPKAGQPTYFVEKLWNSVFPSDIPQQYRQPFESANFKDSILWSCRTRGTKHHTIRGGNRFKVGDKFSPRVWSGVPYRSKQIVIAPDIEVVKTWDFFLDIDNDVRVNNQWMDGWDEVIDIARNDGLELGDFYRWFDRSPEYQKTKCFEGQIICWSNTVNY
jgi:hypothetical protein